MELSISGLSKSYGAINALNDINITFEPGITALLGPNGSGKSTLMNILSGNLRGYTGSIQYRTDKNDIFHSAFDKRYFTVIGYMPQYPGMYSNFNVEQYLRYISVIKGVGDGLRGKEKNTLISIEIENALFSVDLFKDRQKTISELSGGMKQRLALAQACIGNPEIIILDEPTAGMDPEQRINIRNYISELAMNKTIVLATHIVSDIENIANRVLILKSGVIITDDTPNGIINGIQNKVWQITSDIDNLKYYSDNFKISNLIKTPGSENVILRVVSEKKPNEKAVRVHPNLEDYYLYVFDNKAQSSSFS